MGTNRALLELSATDGTTHTRIETGRRPVEALTVDSVTGSLWLLTDRELREFGRTGELSRTVKLSRYVRVDDEHAALAVDDAGGVVWLMGQRRLYRFGFDGHLIGIVKIDRAGAPGIMALDSRDSLLWVAIRNRLVAYDAMGQAAGAFALAGRGPVEALAYSPKLASLWVAQRDDLYCYTVSDGSLAARVDLPRDADDFLAPDSTGAVWAAGGRTLVRIDGSGAIDFVLRHILGLRGRLVALVADPSDQSVWAVSEHALVHVGADGSTLQTIRLDDHDGWGRDYELRHRGQKPVGAVRTAALWADVTPPALSFIAPAEAAYVATTTPPLVFHYRDRGSGTDLSSLALAINGQALGITCPAPASTVPAAGTATCALAAPLSQGGQSLSATVKDYAGNASKPATRSFTVDTIPPTITITQPGGRYTNQPHLVLEGHLSEAGTLSVDGAPVTVGTDFSFGDPLDIAEGDNAVTLVATDLAGNTTTETKTITLDTIPPPVPNLGLVSISGPDAAGLVTVTGKPGAVEGGDTVTITDTRTGQSVTVTANADGSFTAQIGAQASDQLMVSATDEAGNTTPAPQPIAVSNLPPDPSQVAPPLQQAGTTPFIDQVNFLWSGANPIQRDLEPDTLVPARVAVIRGEVEDRAGDPLPGVTVRVQGHPEFGHTLSRADGRFDLAVNGGGDVQLSFSKKNYLSAWRVVQTDWHDYALAAPVALLHADPKVTPVAFGTGAPGSVAEGSEETDAAGARRTRIYFPAGTTAEMVMPDGSTRPLTSGVVRATEFTVGPNGPAAMPAKLPPSSAYTYAVDLSVDQAQAAGAAGVQFNQPIPVYVDNFLGFPVGTHVPAAWYDVKKAVWMPIDDGRVVKLLGVDSQGHAELDVDGTGAPAGVSALAALGITGAELAQLAATYQPGATFWRVPVTHFTVYDYNLWGAGADVAGVTKPTTTQQPKRSCTQPGCIITAQTQVVDERVPVTGTPFSLYYSSGREPGYLPPRTLHIPLSGNTLPPDLRQIDLTVEVAGQVFTKSFTPEPNLFYTYTWNGEDAYGRKVVGEADATVKVTYVTPIDYVPIHNGNRTFGLTGTNGSEIIASRDDQFERVTKQFQVPLPNGDSVTASDGLGGWTLGIHDFFDTVRHRVALGTGGTLSNACSAGCLQLVAGGGYFGGVGKQALDTSFRNIGSIDRIREGPDGSLYVASTSYVRRVGPDGVVHAVAGGGSQAPADGIKATNAGFGAGLAGLGIGPQGDVYLLRVQDYIHSQIFRIDSQGILQLVATVPCMGSDMAVAADGVAYVICFRATTSQLVIRIGPDGTESTAATGPGLYGDAGLHGGGTMNVCSDGNLYYWSSAQGKIMEIEPDGTHRSLGYAPPYIVSGIGCGPAGGIYITQDGDDYNNGIYYRPPNGTFRHISSSASRNHDPANGKSLSNSFFVWSSVTYSHSYHALIIAGLYRVWLVREYPLLRSSQGLASSGTDAPGGAVVGGSGGPSAPSWVADPSGSLLYEFAPNGLQTETLDSVTGGEVYSFSYDAANRLVSITDASGNVTTIRRDSEGRPTAIVAPDGQTTTLSLDGNGRLASLTDPAGHAYAMTYTDGGLIASFADPDGHEETYGYDAYGRLHQNQTAAGGGWTISRAEQANGYDVSMRSAAGHTWDYKVTQVSADRQSQVVTAPDGTQTETVSNPGRVTSVTSPDGTVTRTSVSLDPRFGLQAPLPSVSIKTPSGLNFQTSLARAASPQTVSEPLAPTSLTQRFTVNSRTYISQYDAASSIRTVTTPAGRVVTAQVDGKDRPVTVKAPALATVAYAYDAAGHLSSVAAGSGGAARTVGFAYYASGPDKGWLQSVTDALGRTTSYVYGPAGRVTSETLPNGQAIDFGYDAAGNLVSVTPPSRPAHGMGYTTVNQLASYSPPAASGAAAGAVHYSYNLDRQLTGIALPSGKSVNLQYDGGAQLASLIMPSGQYQYGYSATTGQLTSLIAGPDNESLGFAWDGFLPTQTAWSGPVTGTVAATYDNNFRVTALAIDGKGVAYGYDADGLLIQAGDLTIDRDAASGFVAATTLGAVGTTQGYDRFGEITSFAAAAGTSARYSAAYTYNKDREITAKDETVGGVATDWSYGYDANGRLTSVTEGGATTTYGYDANGNRVSVDGTTVATYNARDQLLTYGGNRYSWNADGELATKTTPAGTTHYAWNALGELTDVALADGTTIHYLYDGMGRRVGKEKNGTLVAGYLYAGSRIVAETDAGGAVTERFVYATKPNVPAYMIKYNADGTASTYRIVSDQVGSVRGVIDASTGAAVQRIDYDVWGNITSDTDPGFEPFAFAGGLYDADTGLVHFGARDYDPETGRWISRDPILYAGLQSNLYEYDIDDTVNGIDPSGDQEIMPIPLDALIMSQDEVIPEPIQPPPDPLKTPPTKFADAFKDYYRQLRPGVEQPRPLPPPGPEEPLWFGIFRLLHYVNRWPWGSLDILLWTNPCPNAPISTTKKKPHSRPLPPDELNCIKAGWCA